MLVYGRDRVVARWVRDQLKDQGDYSFDPCVAIGVVRNGELVAGVVYSNYRHGNIEITMASKSPRWASRENMAALLGYPFNQLKCRRVTCIVKATNHPVREFLCRLGFKEEGICRQAYDDGTDAVLLGMLRSECRWLAEEVNGKISTLSAAAT